MPEKPGPLPVRKIGDGSWEVLVASNNQWLPCESENDARLVGAVPIYEYESLERIRSGREFAEELECLADVLEKYRIGFGSRFFRRRAEDAKNQP